MATFARRGISVRRLAPAALVPAGAVAVHQLRYWLAFHSLSGAELQRQGHNYLHSVVPWIVLFIGFALGTFVREVGAALGGRGSLPRQSLSFAGLWLICVAALLALYIGQETLEGLFATGHPAGVAGVFGFGGLWSLPAAACVGLVLAATCYGARRVLVHVTTRRPPLVHRRPLRAARRLPGPAPRPRLAPVEGGWSDRGPPR